MVGDFFNKFNPKYEDMGGGQAFRVVKSQLLGLGNL